MANKVMMTLPRHELKRADAIFEVYQNGKKFGTLNISNGSIVWFPKSTQYGCKMRWAKFDQIMDEHATREEKR